ncbi:MAG: NAD(P)H-hydrate epimerase [Planctomycetes bacterium]|nr:NAD(P)H-hydrate epimerase [Planctomycetota bacterium]
MTTLTLTRQQSREIDALAIERYGIPGMVLMENAGRGVVDVLLGVEPGIVDEPARSVMILCGKGNNAGDGFVIARHLDIRGVSVKVILLAAAVELRGDARTNYEILSHSQVPIVDLSGVGELAQRLDSEAVDAAWIVDAMLGTGARGEPREPLATAIRWMNAQPRKRLAVDLPSGLDCDTGQPAAITVRADITCTFVAVKQGFSADSAHDFLGELHVVSIGTPPSLLDEVVTADDALGK